ncbi:MAG TPA: helix-turn-helix domain-containing protein, partial [Methylomirabilota bacterium]|nr:helix-turn-helix domain-containing protein [Methylomirabilota bacterium]
MEARRLQAAPLFARGESQAAVARQLGVTTAAVNHWHRAWRAQGRTGLKAAGRAGRKPRLGPPELRRIEHALRAGPEAHGFATALWTLPRVAVVIKRLTGVA